MQKIPETVQTELQNLRSHVEALGSQVEALKNLRSQGDAPKNLGSHEEAPKNLGSQGDAQGSQLQEIVRYYYMVVQMVGSQPN